MKQMQIKKIHVRQQRCDKNRLSIPSLKIFIKDFQRQNKLEKKLKLASVGLKTSF